ncbi:hypothetical protein B0T17DRAFT_71809 [Bombardia bombarda]|uniref:Secreted protein n=1 Tax=Bombardia bombarda TaxID=252184 RepID=A0AA40CG26_9PEZI|nr:hypothetical protein B0T17DRAFT_71809 [Bombardia bombarda]
MMGVWRVWLCFKTFLQCFDAAVARCAQYVQRDFQMAMRQAGGGSSGSAIVKVRYHGAGDWVGSAHLQARSAQWLKADVIRSHIRKKELCGEMPQTRLRQNKAKSARQRTGQGQKRKDKYQNHQEQER